MKIKEYKEKTVDLIKEFEALTTSSDPIKAYKLFDAIDLRLLDVEIWETFGLTDEDEVPDDPSYKLIFPQFNNKSQESLNIEAKCEHNWVMDGHNAGEAICSKCSKDR